MRVYLAGPINGCTDDETHGWREDAKQRLFFAETVNPARRDYRGTEDLAVWELVAADMADIASCDALVAYCSKPSVGTSMEVMYAHGRGLHVVSVVPEGLPVSPWLRYHSHHVVRYMMEAAGVLFRESVRG